MKQIKNTFFINTLIILITGFIIKFLGLINRIFITRILGTEGMSLYILSFPTIMLFISISGLSLNISVSKLVSENIITKKLSPKLILISSIKLSLVISLITIIIFLCLLNPLTTYGLKNQDLTFPLLSTIFLIPLVGISDTLRGYFNGLKDMKNSSISSLLEQIFRILSSILLLYIFIPYGVKTATFFCLISLSIGEIASILFCLIKIKKTKVIHYENTSNELKEILQISIPSTMSKLVGNFTFFLEPIFYLWILTKLHYPTATIQAEYTIVNAYTISLLTLGSFVSTALATTALPSISEHYALKDYQKVNYYIKKTIIFSLIPGIFISIILYFYPHDIMNFIYNTTNGTTEIKKYVIFFIPYYIQAPIAAIYQAIGKSKQLSIFSSLFNILRLLLILLLSTFSKISYDSLIISTFITLDLFVCILFFKIKKLTSFKISFNQSISIFLLTLLSIFTTIIFKHFNINFIISILILFIIYIFIAYKLKLINIFSINQSNSEDYQ